MWGPRRLLGQKVATTINDAPNGLNSCDHQQSQEKTWKPVLLWLETISSSVRNAKPVGDVRPFCFALFVFLNVLSSLQCRHSYGWASRSYLLTLKMQAILIN